MNCGGDGTHGPRRQQRKTTIKGLFIRVTLFSRFSFLHYYRHHHLTVTLYGEFFLAGGNASEEGGGRPFVGEINAVEGTETSH